MLSVELLGRLRKELTITGSAVYETVLAIAERVNRKVHTIRLHARADQFSQQLQALFRQAGCRLCEALPAPDGRPGLSAQPDVRALEQVLASAATHAQQVRQSLTGVEAELRQLKLEALHEDLLKLQRELALRDAVIERVVVARGAPAVGRPLAEFDQGSTFRIAAVMRGPFLLPLPNTLRFRPDDVLIVMGTRADLERQLPQFHSQRPIKPA